MSQRKEKDFSKDLPGSQGVAFTLQEGIEDLEARIAARRSVMLALSGQLSREDIQFPMLGLSIGATGELGQIVDIVEENGPQDKTLLDTFTLLPIFV